MILVSGEMHEVMSALVVGSQIHKSSGTDPHHTGNKPCKQAGNTYTSVIKHDYI